MPRGRTPKSLALKAAQGNPGRRKSRAKVAAIPTITGTFETPSGLSAGAKRIWQQLSVHLASANFVRPTDMFALARYCEHMSTWWAKTAEIQRDGETVVTKSKHVEMIRLHPAFLVRERVERHLVEMEDRFGLNPSFRLQIVNRFLNQGQTPSDGLFSNPAPTESSENEPPSPIGILHGGQPRGLN